MLIFQSGLAWQHSDRHETKAAREKHEQRNDEPKGERDMKQLVTSLVMLVSLAANSAQVRIVDADTIEIGSTTYRLEGIDAPESRQRCRERGSARSWSCGARASEALREYAAGKWIKCVGTSKDRYGRIVATCYANRTDLNGWLVENGWATAATKYSRRYAPHQRRAQQNARGIWSSEFIVPWRWRRGERLQ